MGTSGLVYGSLAINFFAFQSLLGLTLNKPRIGEGLVFFVSLMCLAPWVWSERNNATHRNHLAELREYVPRKRDV